jgi:hypothetical protein
MKAGETHEFFEATMSGVAVGGFHTLDCVAEGNRVVIR